MSIVSKILDLVEDVAQDTEARAESLKVFNFLWRRFRAYVRDGEKGEGFVSGFISDGSNRPLNYETQNRYIMACFDANTVVSGCDLDFVRFIISNNQPPHAVHKCGRGGEPPHIIEIAIISKDPLHDVLRQSARSEFELKFLHEYTHFQDSVRGKHSRDTINLYKEKGRKAYLSTPEEFNAWFQAAIHKYLRATQLNTPEKVKVNLPGFQAFKIDFLELTGYPRKEMKNSWAKRFDKRLAMFYQAFKDNPENFLQGEQHDLGRRTGNARRSQRT